MTGERRLRRDRCGVASPKVASPERKSGTEPVSSPARKISSAGDPALEHPGPIGADISLRIGARASSSPWHCLQPTAAGVDLPAFDIRGYPQGEV